MNVSDESDVLEFRQLRKKSVSESEKRASALLIIVDSDGVWSQSLYHLHCIEAVDRGGDGYRCGSEGTLL